MTALPEIGVEDSSDLTAQDETLPMTPEAAIAALRACQELAADDPQLAHVQADEVLRQLLITLGHGDVVEEFDKSINWFV